MCLIFSFDLFPHLSQFTGSYSYSGFRSCIAINPWDTRSTAEAIHQSLTMPAEEARSRWEDLHNHVTTQTAQAFVTTFLNRVVRSNVEHGRVHGNSFGVGAGGVGKEEEGDGGHVVPNLGPQLLISKYKHSERRLILVDFEGTLWRRDLTKSGLVKMMKMMEGLSASASVNVSVSSSRSTSSLGSASGSSLREDKGDGGPRGELENVALPEEVEEAIRVLGRLAEDGKNEVWLLSGLRVEGVLEKVAEIVPKAGIV